MTRETIFGSGGTPYLTRWFLLGYRALAPWLPFSVRLHHFYRPDEDRELHNHPWRWAVSLVLRGSYLELRQEPGDRPPGRLSPVRRVNFLRHDTFHQIAVLRGDVWTLFITGPKVSSWGFRDPVTGAFTPWRAFFKRTEQT